MNKIVLLFCLLAFAVEAPSACAQTVELRGCWGTYPAAIQKRVNEAEHKLEQHRKKLGIAGLEGVFESGRLWKPGSEVTVAFRNGEDQLCAKVAAVADRWTKHGNIALLFTTADGKIRRWSPADVGFAADIRVDFDPKGGDCSLVGSESCDPALIKPGEASMNLASLSGTALPIQWEGVVLHEFGHALGFHHEHQHPTVPCDFRWNDDPGYAPTKDTAGKFVNDSQGKRPGIYTKLGGPPWNLEKSAIEANFAKLDNSTHMYIASDGYDSSSIMGYQLSSWMLKGGNRSHCNTSGWSGRLSPADIIMMGKAYPTNPEEIRKREESIRGFEKLKADSRSSGK